VGWCSVSRLFVNYFPTPEGNFIIVHHVPDLNLGFWEDQAQFIVFVCNYLTSMSVN
jgi:hypothetical protein